MIFKQLRAEEEGGAPAPEGGTAAPEGQMAPEVKMPLKSALKKKSAFEGLTKVDLTSVFYFGHL